MIDTPNASQSNTNQNTNQLGIAKTQTNKNELLKNQTDKDKIKTIDELEQQENELKQERLYGGRFMIDPKVILGKGSFGVVYLAYDNIMEVQVALKLEKTYKDKIPKVLIEKRIMENLSGVEGIPKYYGQGIKNSKHFLANELLGPNLQKLFEYCNLIFSIKSICLIAIQALNLLEQLHEKGFIHRDIKPENFTIGIENTNKIYLIDYGLCREYRSENGNHIEYAENKSLVGTTRFVSINTHLGVDQTRRDDLESLGYVILYFLLGFLPWQGISATNKEKKYKKILKRKMSIVLEQVCTEFPDEFCYYFQYVKALKFSEKPDYQYLRCLFISVLDQYYPQTKEFDFEWNRIRNKNNNNKEGSNKNNIPSIQITSFKSNIYKETGMFQDDHFQNIVSRKNSVFSLKNSKSSDDKNNNNSKSSITISNEDKSEKDKSNNKKNNDAINIRNEESVFESMDEEADDTIDNIEVDYNDNKDKEIFEALKQFYDENTPRPDLNADSINSETEIGNNYNPNPKIQEKNQQSNEKRIFTHGIKNNYLESYNSSSDSNKMHIEKIKDNKIEYNNYDSSDDF